MDVDGVARGRLGWWVAGAVLGAAVAFVVFSFVGTFVFGVFIYYATRPIYRRIRRRVRRRSIAAAISLVALALPALTLVSYALLVALREANRVLEGFDPAAFGIDPALLEMVKNPAALLAVEWQRYVDPRVLLDAVGSLSSVVDTLAFLGIGLLHLFVMLALAFYLLRDGHTLSRWFLRRFGDDAGVLRSFAIAVDRDFRNIFFGNILNAVLTGTIGVLVYSLLNVFAPPTAAIPAPALVGLLAGVASLIPVVGMKLVYVPVTAVMGLNVLAAGEPSAAALTFLAAFVAVSFVVVDTIPDLVLRPYVSGRSLHVGAVMLAYTLGPLLFGWYGIFLMPMLLVVTVHFARIVLPELVSDEPIRPYAVDPGAMAGGRADAGGFQFDEPGADEGTADGGVDDGTG